MAQGTEVRVYNESEFRECMLNSEFWQTTYTRLRRKSSLLDEEKKFLDTVADNTELQAQLVDSVIHNEYQWGTPRKLRLSKSGTTKKRIVYMYPVEQRLVLGVLYRALSEYFSSLFSPCCFSYKRGVSTGNALGYIRNTRGSGKYFGVKVDIHAYFNSVSEERVFEMVQELFGESDLGDCLSRMLFDNQVIDGYKVVTEFKSLVAGCALGSFFANYCLRELDNYFDSRGIIYTRYSDDILIMTETREEQKESLGVVLGYLEKYGLTLNEKKYEYFEPDECIDYLGLKLRDDGKIDLATHSKQKIKKSIYRWCKKGRCKIEMGLSDFETEARYALHRFNSKNFKCFFTHKENFGWCLYAFRYITTVDSLRELDYYVRDTLRAMKTGKHNKANCKAVSDDEFLTYGYVSLVDLFNLYKRDYDYFVEVIELI